MILKRPIKEVIAQRTSVRGYTGEKLTPDSKTNLFNFIEKNKYNPFIKDIELYIVDNDIDSKKSVSIGTYGFIKGAKSFLAGKTKNTPEFLMAYGYVFEKALLFAQSMGISSCWLGGTFKRSALTEEIQLNDDEIIPAVSPLGYAMENRRIMDKAVRFAAGSKKRKSWSSFFYFNDFETPANKENSIPFSDCVEMVRLAPSASNKQPWILVVDDIRVHFYKNTTKKYPPKNALGFDIQYIDMGIAMCHFELTAQEQGLKGKWTFKDSQIPSPENKEYQYIASYSL